jgi:uncharacterized protein (UPF0332 family)
MQPAAKAYLDKSKNNIHAIEVLIGTDHFEIVASRAYYAMFYAALALLIEEGEEHSSHGAVQSAFGRLFARTGRIQNYIVISSMFSERDNRPIMMPLPK